MAEKSADALNDEQLRELARYFDEQVISAKYYKTLWVEVPRPATE
ncbi:MAG TPA: hypothetical protein VFE21_03680 [Rubrobacteraceae bacterium]|nr:hypothetical protein [Rubrobacteraceae bacterium]